VDPYGDYPRRQQRISVCIDIMWLLVTQRDYEVRNGGNGMKLGVLLGALAGGESLAAQAAMLEMTGFDSLWAPQAIGRGFMLIDTFVTLSVIAAATSRVTVGSAVVQVPLYAPADLASRVLSLAQVSGGRMSLGVGAGSTEADFRAFGRDYTRRFKEFDEAMPVLRELLDRGCADGVDLSPPDGLLGQTPLLLGTWGKGVERAASEFDGWIASARYRSPEHVINSLDAYRRAGGKRAVVSTIGLSGEQSSQQTRELLQSFERAGFDEAVVMFGAGAPTPAEIRDMVR
jgi:alkanesulfonate monooxygenase SsuD/methylene tetrahydromethanopterin reductase-like flavin-dependent oxidoreductase (luciferase family)